jgi:FMN phosphatase YigB (HAD superfamily)
MTGSVTVNDLRGKYIFWDIDGTLAPYRFNDHVSDPDGTNNGQSIEEINSGVFLNRKPSKHMQNVVNTCGAKKHIIMGHCQVKKEMEDKEIWLDIYYPMIEERLLVYEDKSKADTILRYCKEHNIDLHDVVFVDDVLRILREAERKGIKSYHISSFLDWNYQFISENSNDTFFNMHNG